MTINMWMSLSGDKTKFIRTLTSYKIEDQANYDSQDRHALEASLPVSSHAVESSISSFTTYG